MRSRPVAHSKDCNKRQTLVARFLAEIITLVAAFGSCALFAQSPESLAHKGTLDISVWAAGETGEENSNTFTESQLASAGATLGFVLTGVHGKTWWRGSLEYAFGVMPIFETWGNQRVHGGGFDPLILRWNAAIHSARISPYIELAGGALITSSNLPPGNTSNFNFTPRGGGGIYVRTKRRQAFDIGIGWSHISNANLGNINPEFNGVRLSVAYHWFK